MRNAGHKRIIVLFLNRFAGGQRKRAHCAAVKGPVKGNVQLTKEADFIGDIRAKNFLMEEGAYFKGSIELDREPNRKELFVKTKI